MEETFRQFDWPVATAYHWQDWLDARGRRLTIPTDELNGLEIPSAVEHTWGRLQEENRKIGPVIGPVLAADGGHRYSPMSRNHAALFKIFADLDYMNLDAIAGFVAKYGLLGLPMQDQAVMVKRRGKSRCHKAFGESHIEWAREICRMREALQLVRSLRTTEEDTAAWNRVGLEPPYEERRRKRMWLFNVHLQQVQARMSFEPDKPPRLSYAPLTLLAAMWLQLALAVVGDKEFPACKFCRRVFEISTDQTGFRRHREFCSDSCKTKDYRRRKRTALKLASQGASASTVAKHVETDRATVEGWLSRPKGERKEVRKANH